MHYLATESSYINSLAYHPIRSTIKTLPATLPEVPGRAADVIHHSTPDPRPLMGWWCHFYTFSPQKTFSQKKFENGVTSVTSVTDGSIPPEIHVTLQK